MALRTFGDLGGRIKNRAKKTAVVAAGHDRHVLEALAAASREGYIDYLLTGNKAAILEIARDLHFTIPENKIIDVMPEYAAAEKAVSLIREGRGDFLMKGKLETAALMKAVINREKGIRKESLLSHIAFFEAPAYPKLLCVTDGGMIPYPDFEQKKNIVKNAVDVFKKLGVEKPKVAVLAASEKVSERMSETGDAQALKSCGERGEFGDCFVEGPVSLDLALSAESAAIKGYASPVTGDVDILVVPNIACGNILGKSMIYLGNAKMAGCVVGAQVPIELTSRGASAEEKHWSILLTAALSV